MADSRIINEVEIIGKTQRGTIKNLRIDILAEKTEKSSLNKCELSIFNLNDSTIANLEGATVVVRSGYDQAETIFIGDVDEVDTNPEPPDKLTIISLLDGEKNLNTLKVSKTYKEGTRAVDILRDLARDSGYPFRTDLNALNLENITFNFGYSVIAPVRIALDRICSILGVSWSVQNEEIKIVKDGFRETEITIILSPQTGLIGTPQKIKIKDTRNNKKTIDGLRVFSKAQPKAEIGSNVQLSYSDNQAGSLYKIRKVTHDISNWDGEKKTILEVSDV